MSKEIREIKSCPKCGGKMYLIMDHNDSYGQINLDRLKEDDMLFLPRWKKSVSVECSVRYACCGKEVTDKKTKEIVVEMWNRRLDCETD